MEISPEFMLFSYFFLFSCILNFFKVVGESLATGQNYIDFFLGQKNPRNISQCLHLGCFLPDSIPEKFP